MTCKSRYFFPSSCARVCVCVCWFCYNGVLPSQIRHITPITSTSAAAAAIKTQWQRSIPQIDIQLNERTIYEKKKKESETTQRMRNSQANKVYTANSTASIFIIYGILVSINVLAKVEGYGVTFPPSLPPFVRLGNFPFRARINNQNVTSNRRKNTQRI